MKKNTMMRIASVLLVAVVLTTCAISGTFAKYTSTKGAEDSARVANWSFTVNDKDIAKNEAFTFDLFKTIKDTAGADEADVAKTAKIIAPGTSGEFTINLKNASEVTATYAVKYTVTKSDSTLPILFSVDDGKTWTADLAEVAATRIEMNNTASITVDWKWDFEQTDKTVGDGVDTTLGTADNKATVTVKADITATQVD